MHADPDEVLAWMRDAGFTLYPWQERLTRMMFADPSRPLVLAEPYRNRPQAFPGGRTEPDGP